MICGSMPLQLLENIGGMFSSGFIGRHCITILVDKGHEVYAVYYPEPIEIEDDDSVFRHRYDLLECGPDKGLLEEVKPTHILHFTWHIEHGQFWGSIENVR